MTSIADRILSALAERADIPVAVLAPDRRLIETTLKLTRKSGGTPLGPCLILLAHYSEGHDVGITPADLCDALGCTSAQYVAALASLNGIVAVPVPPAWRLS